MKKVIAGCRYNTETAKRIGSDSYGYPKDFSYWCEELYRTKSGKYFVYGTGGSQSKYRRQLSYNEWSGGEAILPLSEDEARKWAEEHLDSDTVEVAFGGIEEETIRISVFLPANLVEKMDAKGDELHCARAAIIEAALKKYLS